jgi:hypothetical protein
MTSIIKVDQIQTAAGTSVMSFDSSGRVSRSGNVVAFKASLSGNMNAPSQSTWTTITYNTTEFDIGNNFNTSTNAFTAPVTGVYHFYHSMSYIANTGSESGGIIAIYDVTNSTSLGIVDFYIKGSNARYGSCCSCIASLAAGTQIVGRIYGPSRGVDSGTGTQLSGYLIG